MAKSVGTSSSLREVLDRVMRIDRRTRVTDLDSLTRVIQERRQWIEQKRIVVAEEIRKEAAVLHTQGLEALQAVERRQPQRLEEAKARASIAADQAAELRSRTAGFGMRIINHVRAFLRTRSGRKGIRKVENETSALLREAARCQTLAQKFMSDPAGEIERRLERDVKILRQLEAISESPEARGAAGELAVEAELRALSDKFWVFHDVRLQADSFMRFDGKPVQSAQVDHLIVGPTGVFLLETKSWSKRTALVGGYFDPYEQVGRAGLLCHCLLKDAGLPDRVTNIIVSHQRMPTSDHQRYTVNVRPGDLVRCVTSRKAALSVGEIENVASFLRRRVGRPSW